MSTLSSHSEPAHAKSGPVDDRWESLYGSDFSRDGRQLLRWEIWKLRAAVVQRLRQYPYFALVKECPGIENAKDFRRISKSFGRFSPSFQLRRLLRGKNFPEPVAEVRVDPHVAEEGQFGTSYSSTAVGLEPHTDGSFRRDPYDILMLYCVVSDDEGGDTILVPSDDLIAKLGKDTCERLRAPVFPFANQVVPIISSYRGKDSIRYYRTQLVKSIREKGAALSEASLQAIEDLNHALKDDSVYIRFKLQPGDLVFVNNRRTMHGRTDLGANGSRLLFRDRLFRNDL